MISEKDAMDLFKIGFDIDFDDETRRDVEEWIEKAKEKGLVKNSDKDNYKKIRDRGFLLGQRMFEIEKNLEGKGIIKIECGDCNYTKFEYIIIDKICTIGSSIGELYNAPCIKINGGFIYFDEEKDAEKAFSLIMEAFLDRLDEKK